MQRSTAPDHPKAPSAHGTATDQLAAPSAHGTVTDQQAATRSHLKSRLKWLLIVLSPVIVTVCALPLGRYPVSLEQLWLALAGFVSGTDYGLPDPIANVLFNIRLPRIAATLLVGAALAVSGSAYQGIFRNPLVSPDILGASAGAGFGAALAILMSWSVFSVQLSAFLFGVLAVAITYGLSARMRQGDRTLVLILTGVLVGTLFSSSISFIKYVADPYDKLPAITFWLMGSLASVSAKDVYLVLVPIVLGFVPLYLVRWRLNVISFGDEEAQALGINTKRLRLVTIFCSTLLTASVVAISGMIGWVGLVIPHLARALVGPNYRALLPATVFIGSAYMLLVDTLARVLLPVEIPLGILTSFIGAPFFIFLLARSRKGWT